ncbi:MAG: hypothetical protein R3Y09_11915 [Clostridia bacterium]
MTKTCKNDNQVDSKVDYITVSEFARKVGISRQAIYNRLEKDLFDYLVIIEGKKHINIDAITMFTTEVDKCKNECKEDDNLLQNTVKLLTDTIDVLKEQLNTKDKQINELNERLQQALSNQSESNKLQAFQVAQLEASEREKKSWLGRIFGKK